jgi:hypothetical protein
MLSVEIMLWWGGLHCCPFVRSHFYCVLRRHFASHRFDLAKNISVCVCRGGGARERRQIDNRYWELQFTNKSST